MNPPSERAVKTWFLCVKTRYTIQRAVQNSIHSKTVANIDASIKITEILAALRRFFRFSVCGHTTEFSFYAHRDFDKSHSTATCTQNTRKHRNLHRNSIQGEESNLQQNPSHHKQGIQNTPPLRLKSSTHALLHPWHDQIEST